MNNTKEFMINYAGKESVGARIESVTDQSAYAIHEKIRLLNVPTMTEQVTTTNNQPDTEVGWQAGCWYLGCGDVGRVARALKDQAKFLSEIKLDPNNPPILEQSLRSVQVCSHCKTANH